MSRPPADPDPVPATTPDAGADAALTARLHASRVLLDAPETVVHKAIGIFQRHAAAQVPAPSLLQRLVAQLRFDSGLQPGVPQGVRGAGTARTRQLLFSSEGRDIDLRILPVPGRHPPCFDLAGQMFGPDEPGTVQVVGDGYLASAAWNERSEFHLNGVPAGVLRITLSTDAWQIELPPVDLAVAG